MNFMKFEKVLAERKDKVIYKDGDKCIEVFYWFLMKIIKNQIF